MVTKWLRISDVKCVCWRASEWLGVRADVEVIGQRPTLCYSRPVCQSRMLWTVSWPSAWWTLGRGLTLRVELKDVTNIKMANTCLLVCSTHTHMQKYHFKTCWIRETCAGERGLVHFPRTGLSITGQIVSLPKSSWACLFVCVWACSQTNRSQWQEPL